MLLLHKSITILLNLIEIFIVARILLSFLNIDRKGPIIRLVYEMTEPVLGPARDLIAMLKINTGMFDFSPLLAILFLKIIYSIVTKILL